MTLIEALAGVVILGTLLVSIVTANARLTSQAVRTELRIEGCRVADEQLSRLWLDRDNFPLDGSGPVEGRPGWTWSTQRVRNETAATLDAEAVVLSVFSPKGPRGVPAATIEIVVPAHAQVTAIGIDAR